MSTNIVQYLGQGTAAAASRPVTPTLLTSPIAQIIATVDGSGTPGWNTQVAIISA